MNRLVVRTCANIALIKYWGKADVKTNIPAVGSLSMGLEDLVTRTVMAETVSERIVIDGSNCGQGVERVARFLRYVRETFDRDERFEVESENSFPIGAGLASSASGFAALAIGVNELLSLGLAPAELSRLARRGSGSAARSVLGGFVEMSAGVESHGWQIATAEEWPLEVVIAVTATGPKAVGSSEGMERSRKTSPFYGGWLQTHEHDLDLARDAVAARDFEKLADVSEQNCLKMHGVMMTGSPGLIYWNAATMALIHAVRELRGQGVPAFFTIDAGPQVKVVCLPGQGRQIENTLRQIPGVVETISTRVGGEPRILQGNS